MAEAGAHGVPRFIRGRLVPMAGDKGTLYSERLCPLVSPRVAGLQPHDIFPCAPQGERVTCATARCCGNK